MAVSHDNRSYENVLRIVWYQNKCDKHHKKRKDHHMRWVRLLFFWPDLMGGLTLFGEEEKEQWGEEELIYLRYRYSYLCPSIVSPHYHAYQTAGICKLLVPFLYFHYD